MNQKFAFYLISIIFVFFIGYSYSQFNLEPSEPVIITIDNSEEIKGYQADLKNLQMQLEELDNQLIDSLDKLNKASKKVILSSTKVQVLEEELESSKGVNQKEIKSLNDQLDSALIKLEISRFELELLKE
tara:strand:+ start:98 stop:487 length:390 start_codon:yes stop_codon:yes gene_type:complete